MCLGGCKTRYCLYLHQVNFLESSMSLRAHSTDNTSAPISPAQPAQPTKPTGQKRSLERGKATHKKNPGKRAKQGGG